MTKEILICKNAEEATRVREAVHGIYTGVVFHCTSFGLGRRLGPRVLITEGTDLGVITQSGQRLSELVQEKLAAFPAAQRQVILNVDPEEFIAQWSRPTPTPTPTPEQIKEFPRAKILDTAREAVTQDRAATHGAAEDTFGRIAALWSARLGITLEDWQVAIMLADLKTARAWGNPGHEDNWVDLAGYAACGGELAAAKS